MCAETSCLDRQGVSAGPGQIHRRLCRQYNAAPDFFALQQYDGVNMAIAAVKNGARTPEDVQKCARPAV